MGQKKKKNGTHNEYFVLLHLFARLRSQTLGRTCACLRSVINAPVVPRRRWGRVARWDVCGCRRFLAQKNIFWDRSLHLEGKRGGAEDGETCHQAARKRLQASIPKSKGGGLFLFFFFLGRLWPVWDQVSCRALTRWLARCPRLSFCHGSGRQTTAGRVKR